ncbi:uncharacterized protein BCR38DRAFT_438397 [Pseudomassariella vexata]|uniref:Uncharacterized protein n=1 Tax=Pseudomassariella vexata TaxID=1141098 RepID=A0A1Y2DT07_9PEZI|nr:uncharacterized protein BCR38DRAFT_438397 [Pseudomassariella vexata]ORY62408.1 hypothetical protein BCR38DRAFT_438397 [Pseudomassariella vexata]
MAEIPVIQVLNKEHYFAQKLVSLPNEVPYSDLAPSSLRLKTKVLSLTSNNLTYTKLGFLLNLWDVHPLPPTTPAPYNDASKYGLINAWGYMEVLESTHPSVEKGSYLWGYVPIGTLAQDLEVKNANVAGQVLVTSEYRKHIMPIYNRYLVISPSAGLAEEIEKKTNSPAYEALVRIMFETAYLMNRFAMPGDSKELVHPGMDPRIPWEPETADLSGATVICFAPGSKVGMCFAHQLKQNRPRAKPVRVVAATSEVSQPFVEETSLYDEIVLSTSSPTEFLSKLGVQSGDKVVLIDFGGRGKVGARWTTEIKEAGYSNLLQVGIGQEISETSQADVLELFSTGNPSMLMNANDMRNRAMELVGEKEYFDELNEAWLELKKQGFKGFQVNWGEGMEAVEKGWDSICKSEIKTSVGLAYKL